LLLNLLLKRRGVIYFRWQFPPDIRDILKKRELIRSLGTRYYWLAIKRAVPLYSLVDKMKDVRIAYKMNKLTEDNYQDILKLIWEMHTQKHSDYSDELKGRYRKINGKDEDIKFSNPLVEKAGPSLSDFLESLGRSNCEDIAELANWNRFNDSDLSIDTIERLEEAKEFFQSNISRSKKASYTVKGGYGGEVGIHEFFRPHAALDLLRLGVNDCNEEVFKQLVQDYVHFDIQKYEKLLNKVDDQNYSPPEYIAEIIAIDEGSKLQADPKNLLSYKWEEYVSDKKESGKWTQEFKIAERQAEFRDFIEIIEGDRDCKDISKDIAKHFRKGLITYLNRHYFTRYFPASFCTAFHTLPETVGC